MKRHQQRHKARRTLRRVRARDWVHARVRAVTAKWLNTESAAYPQLILNPETWLAELLEDMQRSMAAAFEVPRVLLFPRGVERIDRPLRTLTHPRKSAHYSVLDFTIP